jgi:hypothetical protein
MVLEFNLKENVLEKLYVHLNLNQKETYFKKQMALKCISKENIKNKMAL